MAAAAACVHNRRSKYPGMTAADRAAVLHSVLDDAKREQVRKLLQKYDTNKSGYIDREEAMAALTELDLSTGSGEVPTKDEVDFVFNQADVYGSLMGKPDDRLDLDEFLHAVGLYKIFIRMRPNMDTLLSKFDTDSNGGLDKGELLSYMKKMKEGADIREEEVNWLMERADVSGDGSLDKKELLRGTVEWYTLSDRKKLKSKACTVL